MFVTAANEIADRLAAVHDTVASACQTAGRNPDGVQLIAVGKRFPVAALAAARDAGQRHFGENYAAELADKAAQLAGDVMWHMIGPLQRRQVALMPQQNLLVHTLDRLELVERFERLRPDGLPPFLVQVNIGGEPSKSGLAPAAVPAFFDALLARRPALDVRGLMTIPPPAAAPGDSRRWFAALRTIGEDLQRTHGPLPMELSMGMSDDFADAIHEGATWIRVGTAIFGARSGII
jgi:pyridoxal phosphate enzyme (YggS family)